MSRGVFELGLFISVSAIVLLVATVTMAADDSSFQPILLELPSLTPSLALEVRKLTHHVMLCYLISLATGSSTRCYPPSLIPPSRWKSACRQLQNDPVADLNFVRHMISLSVLRTRLVTKMPNTPILSSDGTQTVYQLALTRSLAAH
jgi:hypothetical protein